jgi:Transposase DDE domain group 1/Zincin-like metallopeptidase
MQRPCSAEVGRLATAFFAATGAKIEYGGNRAFYAITTDSIRMPPFETFRDSESHAATVVHELTHWTRHPKRLNRANKPIRRFSWNVSDSRPIYFRPKEGEYALKWTKLSCRTFRGNQTRL